MLDNPKQFLRSLPRKPGIYQMYDGYGKLLYVGKAKNLQRRLTSYFLKNNEPKTALFMEQVKNIEIIVTPNENTALLLESNLIKTKKPRYNVLFKDDKSFPYLLLSRHDFPRLSVYRGAVNPKVGKYFGPFPDASAVNFVYDLLQKVFRVRVCQDSFMQNRSRPCMLYQIKLCSAPCVGYIDKTNYALQIKLIEQFLHNKSAYVVQELTKLMEFAVAKLDYERAANYRDQIINIRKVQSAQAVTQAEGNYDVIAIVSQNDAIGIDLLFVRHGLVIGNKNYFPESEAIIASLDEILTAFITHYYWQDNIIAPDKILLNHKISERLKITSFLRQKFKNKIVISDQVRGAAKQLIAMAEANATHALKTRYQTMLNYSQKLLDLKEALQLATIPQRIECFDVSHTMGESQVAACVVFNARGASKKDYRYFNIKTTHIGDDYAALHEALLRRYRHLDNLPDVLMIDGGLGQLKIAEQVLQQLQIKNVKLIAIAKGRERKPGEEEIYLQGQINPLVLPRGSLALYLMQQIRDEAHRFAISAHRKKMVRSRRQSELGNIVGIGKSRQIMLLKHFGGLAELKSAGIDDLIKIKGIGRGLAAKLYEHLHG